MRTVAVTAASGPVGRELLALLDADPRVGTILGVDVVEPDMPPASLEFRVADPRDPVLASVLRGADVIVHLAGWVPEPVSEDVAFARSVHGTRNVLAAAEAVGARGVVHLSTAMVYGAHPDNPVPLGEQARLRASADAPAAYHALLAEELVAAFRAEHPGVDVAVLRPATILGGHVDSPATRLLEALRVPGVAGYDPPLQFADVADVAEALRLAASEGLDGAFNVAPDGWLTTEEAEHVAGRRLLRLPETPALGAVSALHRLVGAELAPGELTYLMHPWVVDAGRLASHGWRAERSNREVLRAAAEEHRRWVRLDGLRIRRRDLYAVGAGVVLASAGLAAGALRRR